jgi:DNA-binding MarR family transcriptional regulator
MGKTMEIGNQVTIGRLMANVCRLQATRIDQLMEALGLYRGQAILLIILSENDGLAHSEIAERLQISPAAATKVIKRMEKLNYLQRRPDLDDERISRVYIQDDGRALIAQIREVFKKVNEIILTNISPAEQETLRELLSHIHVNLQNNPQCRGH